MSIEGSTKEMKNSGNIVVRRDFAESVRILREGARLEKRAKEFFEKYGIHGLFGSAAGQWQFTDSGRTSLLNGTFDIDTDAYKMALFLSTSNLSASSTTYAGVTNEHANNNGYTTGGISVTLTLAGTTTVTVDVQTDPIWTANGGSIVARFAAIYEVGGNILCYCLLDNTPADVSVTDGNTLKVEAHANGIYTLS